MISRYRPSATPAAGGVLWRRQDDSLRIAVVHRPRYDDWTLPKGKLEPGEIAPLAAVREVAEETGAEVELGRRLRPVEYAVGGATKRVNYWVMRYLGGRHEPNEEVDNIRWMSPSAAEELLSYPADRGVLEDFLRAPADATTVLLIRHAKAGKRSEYQGDDRQRPLDKIGRRQARESVPLFAAFRPRRILAADRVRCEQTIQPLAAHVGLPIMLAPQFSDEAYAEDPRSAVKSLLALAEEDGTTALCSQGKAIPGMLADLDAPGEPYPCRKGSAWALSFFRSSLIAADYYPRPAG